MNESGIQRRCCHSLCERHSCIRINTPSENIQTHSLHKPRWKNAVRHNEKNSADLSVLNVCLLHYYTSPTALDDSVNQSNDEFIDRVCVFDLNEYSRQKVEASDLIRDMACELEEDIDRELEEEQARCARESGIKAAIIANNAAVPIPKQAILGNSTNQNDSIRSNDAGLSLSKVTEPAQQHTINQQDTVIGGVSDEDLFIWQMKQREKDRSEKHRQHEEHDLRRKNYESQSKSNINFGKIISHAKGANDFVDSQIRADTSYLQELVGLPEVEWRAKTVSLLASTFGLVEDIATKMEIGTKCLEIELALFEFEFANIGSDQSKVQLSLLNLYAGCVKDGNLTAPNKHSKNDLFDESLGENFQKLQGVNRLKQKANARVTTAKPDCRSAYNQHVRTLVHNLRIRENQSLRQEILSGQISPANLVQAGPDQLMDSTSAAAWNQTKEALFQNHKVVTPLDALFSSTTLDTVMCPHCGNTEKNRHMEAYHLESSKCEVWGNKTDRDGHNERFRCSKCNLQF